jgi:hypothetical protein
METATGKTTAKPAKKSDLPLAKNFFMRVCLIIPSTSSTENAARKSSLVYGSPRSTVESCPDRI